LTTWERPSGKNFSGFVGLRNPGCICYMNSLLQQIYMTPTLRYGLLSSKITGTLGPG
jgi:ubiquitin carboxyl-terminal hydrolase 9/24